MLPALTWRANQHHSALKISTPLRVRALALISSSSLATMLSPRLKPPLAMLIELSRRGTMSAAAPALCRLVQLTLSRRYTPSVAVQPQLDPDYNHNNTSNQHGTNRNGVSQAAVADSEGSIPPRGVHWAFIGCPLAKKRVYAETISKLLGVPHISMASLVRQELNPGSLLYKQIASAVNRGDLVPEDIIFGLLSKRLEDGYYKGESGFILDGIPRSRFQAEILDQVVEIDLVVNFKCPDDYLAKHQQEGAWKEKLKAYFEESKRLEGYYQKQQRLLDFQMGSAPTETWQGLLAALHLQQVNALFSSRKLSVPPSSV